MVVPFFLLGNFKFDGVCVCVRVRGSGLAHVLGILSDFSNITPGGVKAD